MPDIVTELRRAVFLLGMEPSRIDEYSQAITRRIRGDYQVDEYGFDIDFTRHVFLPIIGTIAHDWFRLEVRGADNLPPDGGALLVANHSGTIPLDSLVLQAVVHDHTDRFLRLLAAAFLFRSPVLSDYGRRIGATMACVEDAERLLTSGELVGVFPEGFKGLGKPITDRYRLQRFGRGGFVATAIRTQVPIIPVSIVGAEEAYPQIGNLSRLAKALDLPYFPVTPFFPWLGPLGAVPLPTKWTIDVGRPIPTHRWHDHCGDPATIFSATDQVRQHIQTTLHSLLKERSTPFW